MTLSLREIELLGRVYRSRIAWSILALDVRARLVLELY